MVIGLVFFAKSFTSPYQNFIPNDAEVIQTFNGVSLYVLPSEQRAYVSDNDRALATFSLSLLEEPKIIGVTNEKVYLYSIGQTIGAHGPLLTIHRKDGAIQADAVGEYWATSSADQTLIFSSKSCASYSDVTCHFETIIQLLKPDGQSETFTIPVSNTSDVFNVDAVQYSPNENLLLIVVNNQQENQSDKTKYHGALFIINLEEDSIKLIDTITSAPVVIDGYGGTRPFSQVILGWIEDEQIRVLDNGQEKVISLTE